MRGHLVFNPGPHLIGIDKGQCWLAAVRPCAQQQSRLMSHGVTRALRVRMLTEIGLEVVREDGLQRPMDLFLSQRSFDSVASRHPCADSPVGKTSASVLIFRAFTFQEFLHFTTM